ncbi:hypothetical protein [Aquimarina litoralis]|uniref:hypothetical protein n=1 Tax=Aquimarina litoralis TaxID=584605 RepID=UPI001C58CC56|nr:hypothetical protein [Aquimarina litoralis]MBW1298958.1 hypothetical protein [Aquimarina litoralis]
MEQAIVEEQLITRKQSEDIIRWEQEEVLLLARHFQRLNVIEKFKNSFYTRTNFFEMKDVDVKILNTLKKITRIRIYMSLEEEDKSKFTFCPIIQIAIATREEPYYFTLIPEFDKPKVSLDRRRTSMNQGGTIVPGIFKEMILHNWNSIEDNLIDDLFVAKEETTGSLVRVNFFEINSETIIELFNNTFHGNIEKFIMYPGVDMNKFSDRSMISFTPVIGITPKEKVKTEIISRHGLVEFSDEEVFIEYSRPCPPTCTEE